MTAQTGDQLHYNGETYTIASEPLNPYLNRKGKGFISPSTDCWRGYFATWEVKDHKLYLIDLTGYVKNYRPVGMTHIFPFRKRVFAHWFSGEIRVPRGEMLLYIHMGYESEFEEDLFLEFRKGRLVKSRVVDNQTSRQKEEQVFERQSGPNSFWRRLWGR